MSIEEATNLRQVPSYEIVDSIVIGKENLWNGIKPGLDRDLFNPENTLGIARDWDEILFKQNINYLRASLEYLREMIPQGESDDFYNNIIQEFFPIAFMDPGVSARIYREYKNSKSIGQTLAQTINSMQETAAGAFSRYSCDLTSDHSDLDAQLLEGEEFEDVDPRDVGVIIIDNHCDFKDSSIKGKASFGNSIVERGYQVAVIGTSANMIRAGDGLGKGVIYPESVVRRMQNDDESADDQRYSDEDLKDVLLQMQSRGVKRIVFSIDPDVVDGPTNGLTAWEYNMVNVLGIMGVNDWKKIFTSLGLPMLETDQYDQFAQNMDGVVDESLGLILSEILYPALEILSKARITENEFNLLTLNRPRLAVPRALTQFAPSPLKLKSDLRMLIQQAQELGLEIGTPFKGKNMREKRYIGGVTELAGLDLNGNTARFAIDLINTMISTIS